MGSFHSRTHTHTNTYERKRSHVKNNFHTFTHAQAREVKRVPRSHVTDTILYGSLNSGTDCVGRSAVGVAVACVAAAGEVARRRANCGVRLRAQFWGACVAAACEVSACLRERARARAG